MSESPVRGERRLSPVGASEADRLAAHARMPLVSLTTGVDTGGGIIESAALRATFDSGDADDDQPFPSAVGRVPHIAFDTFLVVPNQR